MLQVIVFVCGASLMGLEMVAARVLAPALGNSIYVWGSVIATVMVALSIGYWLGGQLADRFGAARLLPIVIAGASLSTVVAPSIAAVVLPRIAEMGPRMGSLTAATAIFFVPAILLAMVSPLGISIAATSIDRVGRSAGSLYAVSTAGSIVGTIATSFWLVPLLSLEPLIIWIGFLLAAASVRALGLRRAPGEAEPDAEGSSADEARNGTSTTVRRRWIAQSPVPATVMLLLLTVGIGATVLVQTAPTYARNPLGETVLFRADTMYHRVTVTESPSARHLRFDRSHQSAMSLDDEFESPIRYPDYLHLALAAKPDATRVLVIGLGGGTVVKRMWRDYPEIHIDAVEIDPVVIDVAQRYFGVVEDERVDLIAADGRRFVQRTDQVYDIVIVDAYYADALPYHLATEEFFAELKTRMAPDGVLAYNVIGSIDGPQSRLFRSIYRTASASWMRLLVFPIGFGADGVTDSNRNIIVLAMDSPPSEDELLRRIEGRVDGRVTVDGFEWFGSDLYTGTIRLGDVPSLTDDHAPTDSLIDVN